MIPEKMTVPLQCGDNVMMDYGVPVVDPCVGLAGRSHLQAFQGRLARRVVEDPGRLISSRICRFHRAHDRRADLVA